LNLQEDYTDLDMAHTRKHVLQEPVYKIAMHDPTHKTWHWLL